MESRPWSITVETLVMKFIITTCLALASICCVAQQSKDKQKKEPPKVVKVQKSAPVVVPEAEVKKKTPAKYKNKPIPKVSLVKFRPPVVVQDSTRR